MGYRIGYRNTQGQQGSGSAGGGRLLDQIRGEWQAIASGTLPVSLPLGIIPDTDTVDFHTSVLLDVEPINQTPAYWIGRVTLALAGAIASSASAPTIAVKRWRAGASATIATFAFTAIGASTWQPIALSGSNISNVCLVSNDVIGMNATCNGGGGACLPAGTVLVDILG